VATSARSIGSCRSSSAPESALASRSRSSPCGQLLGAGVQVFDLKRFVLSGCGPVLAQFVDGPRTMASGVRSSWLASAAKSRCRSSDRRMGTSARPAYT